MPEAVNLLVKVLRKSGAYPIENNSYGVVNYGMNRKVVITKVFALEVEIRLYDEEKDLVSTSISSMAAVSSVFEGLFQTKCPILRKKAVIKK